MNDGLEQDPKPLWAAVGVAVAGIVGVLIGVLFVHRGFNRKILLMTSALGISVTFSALGIFNLLMPAGEQCFYRDGLVITGPNVIIYEFL